jgi:TRAP-type C4-dicarboxylate transport system permease small subunit
MERFFRYSLTLLMSIVALMMFIQVMARYVFEVPLMGLEEVLVFPTLWLYILGSVNASREDTQIKANVLDVFLKSPKAKLRVRVMADLMSLVVSAWLTWWTWEYFRYALRIWKESPTLYIPTFYAECALFIGLFLMTVSVAYYLARNVKLLLSPETAPAYTLDKGVESP